MKTVTPAPRLLAQIEQILAEKPGVAMPARNATWGPLEESLVVLLTGRQYEWLELVLKLDQGRMAAYSLGVRKAQTSTSEWATPVRIAGHDFGELHVLPRSAANFGPEDQILVKRAARALAAFLGGRGKYLLTRARLQAARSAGGDQTAVASSS